MEEIVRNVKNWKPNMPRLDVPEFTRCCFCLPLRYGLMVWGYIKATFLGLLAYLMIKDLIRMSTVYPMLVIFILIVILDLLFTLVFIVAGHLKHQKLYQIYYYYSLGLLCFYLVFVIWFLCWNWYGYYRFSAELVLRLTLELLTSFLPVFFVQGYVTLLVRTEVRKLSNNSNFEFVNNAAEATCSMEPGVTVDLQDNGRSFS